MNLVRAAVPVVTMAALLTLVGCAAPAPAPAPATSSAPAPSPTPTSKSTPFAIDCEDLVPAPIVTALSSDLALRSDFTPAPGSNAATIVAAGGTACSWTNADASQELTVAVAQPGDIAATEKQLAGTSTPTSAFGTGDVTGFFKSAPGTVGDAEVIAGSYWVSATSTAFTADTVAVPVIQGVLQALPSA